MFLPSVNPFGSLVDLFYIFKSKSESGLFLAFHRLCHAIILCFSYFCSQLLPDVTPAVFAGLSQGAVGILRRCKASYGEVRAGWQAPSLHGQWPWREMKEVPVCTLAAQTGLQSSMKSLLPPLPRCLSCAPYPFHTFFDFRWGGKECHSTLVFGPLFFLSPSSCLSHDLAPFSWSQWASAKLAKLTFTSFSMVHILESATHILFCPKKYWSFLHGAMCTLSARVVRHIGCDATMSC